MKNKMTDEHYPIVPWAKTVLFVSEIKNAYSRIEKNIKHVLSKNK